MVRDGETGYTFESFDAADLAAKIRFLAGDRAAGIERMGRNVQKLIEENLNAEKHYKDLMKIIWSGTSV